MLARQLTWIGVGVATIAPSTGSVSNSLSSEAKHPLSDEGARLDPTDWNSFRQDMHKLLDRCLDRLEGARDHPWQPVPETLRQSLALNDAEQASGQAEVLSSLALDVMPYATGNTHPSFFGWVHGTGLPVGVAADLVASTMNSNCGGSQHGPVRSSG